MTRSCLWIDVEKQTVLRTNWDIRFYLLYAPLLTHVA
jgi:hypothetical protein